MLPPAACEPRGLMATVVMMLAVSLAMLPQRFSVAATACGTIPGYTTFSGANVQDTLRTVTTTTARMETFKNACNKDINCVAFNKKGELKSSTATWLPTPGSCLYVRDTKRCAAIPGYIAIPDVMPALPITARSTTLGLSLGSCSKSASCQGVSHINGLNVISTESPTTTAAMGACFYRKTNTSCTPLAGYTVTPDTDLSVSAKPLSIYADGASAQVACWTDTKCTTISATRSGSWITKARVKASVPIYLYDTCLYTKNYTDQCAHTDPSVTCTNLPGTFAEVCKAGYVGYDSAIRKCADLNECATADTSVVCTNLVGSFSETCQDGYQSYNSVTRKCSDINECGNPDVSVVCINLPGSFIEVCKSGYTGYNVNNRLCTDINECASGVDVTVTCTNTVGSFSEICNSGYTNYNATTRKCTDINECATADTSVTCTNTAGSYSEVCSPGYTSYTVATRKCTDINECLTAGSSVTCTNTAGSFSEVCKAGYMSYNATARKCIVNPCYPFTSSPGVACATNYTAPLNYTLSCQTGYTNLMTYTVAATSCCTTSSAVTSSTCYGGKYPGYSSVWMDRWVTVAGGTYVSSEVAAKDYCNTLNAAKAGSCLGFDNTGYIVKNGTAPSAFWGATARMCGDCVFKHD